MGPLGKQKLQIRNKETYVLTAENENTTLGEEISSFHMILHTNFMTIQVLFQNLCEIY